MLFDCDMTLPKWVSEIDKAPQTNPDTQPRSETALELYRGEILRKFLLCSGELSNKNVDVTTIMFLCLVI